MTAAGIDGPHRLRIDDVVDRAVEHEPTLVQHHDAGRDLAHEVEVMFDQDDGVSGLRGEMPRTVPMVARSALVRPAVGSSSRISRGSSASTMASSSACFMPCDRRPAGESIRSMRPVSRRMSTLATGSDRRGAEPIPLGVSEVVRASLRQSATVRLSKMLAT